MLISLHEWFSNQAQFCPLPDSPRVIWQRLKTLCVITMGGRGAAGILCVEARDAAAHTAVHGTAPPYRVSHLKCQWCEVGNKPEHNGDI